MALEEPEAVACRAKEAEGAPLALLQNEAAPLPLASRPVPVEERLAVTVPLSVSLEEPDAVAIRAKEAVGRSLALLHGEAAPLTLASSVLLGEEEDTAVTLGSGVGEREEAKVTAGLMLPETLLVKLGLENAAATQRRLVNDQTENASQAGSAVRTVQLAPGSTPGSQEELGREARGRLEERVIEVKEEA